MGTERYQDNDESDDEKPPSYFTAVQTEALEFAAISPNGVYGNTGHHSQPKEGSRKNWKHVSINMGRDAGETPPPPYSVTDPLKCSGLASTDAGRVLDGSSGSSSLASPLADILNSSESFTFGPDAQIDNDKGESVLTIARGMGFMNLQDSEGNIHLAMNANVISIQGKTIGKLSVFDVNHRISIKGSTGQSTTVLEGKPQKQREIDFAFIQNGNECGNAKAAPGNNERLQLTFTSALEVNTKALMLLSAALLVEYHERNVWSRMTYPELLVIFLFFIFIGLPLYGLFVICLLCMFVIKIVPALLRIFWDCLPGCTIP